MNITFNIPLNHNIEKISYHRDITFPTRVLTIVRSFNKETKEVVYGWSVNRPTQWKKSEKFEIINGEKNHIVLYTKKKGDNFSKYVGTKNARTKKDFMPQITAVKDGEYPLDAILRHMEETTSLPRVVRELAKNERYIRSQSLARKIKEFCLRRFTVASVSAGPPYNEPDVIDVEYEEGDS